MTKLSKKRLKEHLEWEKEYLKKTGKKEVIINGKLMTANDFFNEAEKLRNSFNDRFKEKLNS